MQGSRILGIHGIGKHAAEDYNAGSRVSHSSLSCSVQVRRNEFEFEFCWDLNFVLDESDLSYRTHISHFQNLFD